MALPVRERHTGHGAGAGTLNAPLSELAKAIEELQQTCEHLTSSVGGINLDLEEKNENLTNALIARGEILDYVENILANIPTGVIVVDRTGKIVLLNSAAEAITGYSNAHAEGVSYMNLLGRGIPEKQTPLFTLATGSSIRQGEKIIVTKSGDTVPVSFSTSLVTNSRHEICGAVEVLTDLTRMKLLEEEVSRTRALATIGEVAAMVAHEIRNPLGGIKGFASLLKRDLASSPRDVELVEKIMEGINTLETIVSDLLTAGSPVSLCRERTDLSSEIKGLVDMLEGAPDARRGSVRFETKFSEEPFYCKVDVARIRQAITNLILNSIDAVGEDGTVSISLESSNRGVNGPRDSGKPEGTREYIHIEVADTGPGIPDHEIERIFSPFFTTKRGGSGLGLANVRKIAGLHGGEVSCECAEGGGSKFIIEIPRW